MIKRHIREPKLLRLVLGIFPQVEGDRPAAGHLQPRRELRVETRTSAARMPVCLHYSQSATRVQWAPALRGVRPEQPEAATVGP
jgi:hypothetical protein